MRLVDPFEAEPSVVDAGIIADAEKAASVAELVVLSGGVLTNMSIPGELDPERDIDVAPGAPVSVILADWAAEEGGYPPAEA